MTDYTEADASRLRRQIASGVLKVKYANGSEITYASISDMREALAKVEGELAGGGKSSGSVRRFAVWGSD